jgi:hypothetical protein
MVRRREDETYGSFVPVDADIRSEDLWVRHMAAIERYRAEQGTAPNHLVIESEGHHSQFQCNGRC